MDARSGPKATNAVSAAELVRNFAECRENAARQDLFVTHHGRATHVLVGVDKYNEMKAAAQAPRETIAADQSAHLLHLLAEWLDEALILCDADMRILFVNRVTQAICRKTTQELTGKLLLEALPQTVGSMLEFHARRTVVGNELSSADIPSPFHPDVWLRFQSFPLGSWNVIMFRDITDEVQHHRLADVKEAVLEALRLHGGICYARVSVRGTIERVNAPCCNLIGLPEDRLLGVALADVIALQDRAEFRAALEETVRGTESRALDTRILTNEGSVEPVRIALVPLHGAYGAEGAVMIVTPGAPA